MWARVVEVALAAFLMISGFIFPSSRPLWIFNCLVAVWIWFFAFVSFYTKYRKAHLMNLLAIAALILYAFIQPNPPPPPPFQNYVVLALLLILFVIIPSEAAKPPIPWRRYYGKKKREE